MKPFHLAIPVDSLTTAREFYVGVLRCSVGRKAPGWIDFNFFGHQLTVHLKPEEVMQITANMVDGKVIPVRHFGIVLPWEEWQALGDRLNKENIPFYIKPHIRFAGEVGEQGTMFLADRSGNIIEFKAFRDPAQLFAT